MRLAAGLLLLVSTAGADSFVRVERKDWVADWSVYVMRSTVTAGIATCFPVGARP